MTHADLIATVKRYDCYRLEDGVYEDPHGGHVDYADFCTLAAALESLVAENARLRTTREWAHREAEKRAERAERAEAEREEMREECAKAERLWKEATIDRDAALRDLARAMQERIDFALAERDALRKDAETWRHIAQEQHAQLWKELRNDGADYPVVGALDALFRSYRKTGKFNLVFCSQCGKAFAHKNYHGYSHCEDHAAIDAAMKEGE